MQGSDTQWWLKPILLSGKAISVHYIQTMQKKKKKKSKLYLNASGSLLQE